MNENYDVIIIGAGPAGCAAALTLSRAHLSVGLFDKAVFPREKTCGDALIPDAFHALEKLGLIKRVVELSCPTHGMRLISRDGSDVLVRAHSACLPRLKLDELLLNSAIEGGARFFPGHDFTGVLDEDGKIYRVEFNRNGESASARARWVLLATGAHPVPIARAGLLLRAECRSFAVRQYVRNERLAKNFNDLVFVFDTTIKGGYGWIFPGPEAVFNIGIGFFGSAHKHNNPRRNYEQFIAKLPLAQELMRDGEIVSPLKGAPLRTGLSGARFAKALHGVQQRSLEQREELATLAADLAVQKERAEAANGAKSRFLAAASHDIRQPVHALSLFLGAFDDAALSGRNAQLIGPLRESARGLREMLDGVLDLSRAEAGAVQAHPQPLPAQALLDLVEREFTPLAEARGLTLRTVPSRLCLLADPTLTERILRNLLSNALRYTTRGGVLVGVRQRGALAVLEVWDTGVGIAAADQEHVFAEFTRGAGAADAERSGLGLGLAIARRFAQAQGAGLTLAARVGRGTVFRLCLPVAPAATTPTRRGA